MGTQRRDHITPVLLPRGFVLEPGATVSDYRGCGTNTANELHCCNGTAAWNNDCDTAVLMDANGNIVDQKSY